MASVAAQFGDRASRFFGWWFSELADCVPDRLREMIGASVQKLVILIADKAVTFEHVKGKTVLWLGSLDLSQSSPAGQRETIREIISDAKLGSAQVVIRLPRGSALRRAVDLPAPALENLREVLGFEMDRHTPFSADEVYFDYHVIGEDRENKQIKVDLVVMARDVADRAISLVTGWGLEPDRLSLADRLDGEKDFNLLPRKAGRSGGAASYRYTLGLAAVAVIVLAVGLYWPLKERKAELAELEGRLEQVRTEASSANDLTQRVEDLAKRSRFVMAQKRDRFSVTELLDEVTRLLPDDTWALQFGQRGDQMTVSGYSVKPSALIGILEGSSMLTQVRFSSPVTADPRVGRDRFNISAQVPEKASR
ncbi:MAG: pilus assembly protein PilM [Rhodospirillales bacterium]|nr:pilus assembly protein PilM [Rhodospirillales bacterium]